MNTIQYMKMAAFEELKEALKIKRVNDELLEYLASSLRWILYYTKKNNMPIPERDRIIELMNKAIAIENKYPSTAGEPTEPKRRTRNQHDSKHSEYSTEQNYAKTRLRTRKYTINM